MRIDSWLAAACLASTASAIGKPAPQPGKIQGRPEGKPEKMPLWKWSDPFSAQNSDKLAKFDATCTAEKTFYAREFLLDDLQEPLPLGLKPFFPGLKKIFAERQYPGSWNGMDPHGYDRNLLEMEYAEVPVKVREWIEEQQRNKDATGRGLFAVYEKPAADEDVQDVAAVPDAPVAPDAREDDSKKVVIFAPGALYEVLPLWVAEGSDCADILGDITKYMNKPTDGGVVAYTIKNTWANRPAERRIRFVIKAQALKAKAGEAAAEPAKKDEL